MHSLLKGVVIVFGASVLNGIFGAGASLIIVPSLMLFGKFESHTALATAQMVLSVLNLSGFAVHIGIGAVNYTFAAILALGAIIGSYLGTRLVLRFSHDRLRRAIAILLLVMGSALIVPITITIL